MLDDIVTAWKNEYDGYLEDIKNRMQTDQATADEIWEVRNLERIVLIYDLMMKNLIEEKGSWQVEENALSADEALNELVRKIDDATVHHPADIHKALKLAVHQGDLTFNSDDGQVKWQWVDYL